MEFATVAEVVGAVEVVHAEGVVAALLDFDEEVARADAVDATCGDEEAVAHVGGVVGQVLFDAAVLNALRVGIGRIVVGKA